MVGTRLAWKEITDNLNIQQSQVASRLQDISAKKSRQVPYRAFSSKPKSQGGNEMYRFLIIIEKGKQNYGAYSPDLPGCIAVGDTLEEVEKNMQEAIKMHLRGMIEDHEPIPTPRTTARYLDITIPNSAA
jgi:predicted RNase H-like HicB family nuclease